MFIKEKNLFYRYQSNAEVSIGDYMEKRYYPIDIVHVEGDGNDFLSIKREKDLSTTWEKDWTGLLTNLLEGKRKFVSFKILFDLLCNVPEMP